MLAQVVVEIPARDRAAEGMAGGEEVVGGNDDESGSPLDADLIGS
jgi:hypothetical protein